MRCGSYHGMRIFNRFIAATALLVPLAARAEMAPPCNDNCRCDLKRIDATVLTPKKLMMKLAVLEEPVVITNLIQDWAVSVAWS